MTARKGLEQDPENYRCTLNLAHCLLVSGQLGEAQSVYRKLITEESFRAAGSIADITEDLQHLRDAGLATDEFRVIEKMLAGA